MACVDQTGAPLTRDCVLVIMGWVAWRAAEALEAAARAPALYAEAARARYGADAADKILALEARLQARFDRVAEAHAPVLWPSLPIRL